MARIALTFFLITLCACSPGARSRSPILHGVLRISSVEDVQGLNPHLSPQAITGFLSELTMAYLMRSDANGRPRPELATAVPSRANGGISADGRTIVYHLRRDARWSDGVPFTADDVVFSTHVVQDPTTNEVRGYGFDRVARVDAIDRYTVRVRLRVPFAPILSTFFGTSSGGPCLLPKHLLATTPLPRAAYNELPIGIGPFLYVRWNRGESVELAANPRYFRGRPRLDRIVYKILPDRNTLLAQMRSGELDLWLFTPPGYVDELRAIPGIQITERTGYGVLLNLLNASSFALRDPSVRHALLLADNRAEAARIFGRGAGPIGDSLFPPGNPLHADVGYTRYDPERARHELEHAGWRVGADGIRVKNRQRLVLRIVTETGTEDVDRRIEFLRASYRAVGIEVQARHYAASAVFGPASKGGVLASGAFDIAPIEQIFSELGDAQTLFGCGMEPPRGFNFGRFCDPELDRSLIALLSDYDTARQRRDAALLQRRFAGDVPALVEEYPPLFVVAGRDVRHYHPNPLVPLDDMLNVSI